MANVQLLAGAWRSNLAAIISAARQSVLVAAPYIKHEEAVWFCDLLAPRIEVLTLANMDVEAVSSSALDIAALRRLAEASDSARIIALSNLHAKVFVADEQAAIITSGNMTRSGLDRNIEFGVLLREPEVVRSVRRELLSFTRLGNAVGVNAIEELLPLEVELRKARADVMRNAAPVAKRRFTAIMREAKPVFASTQIGNRTAHAVFGDAIQFVLERGPQNDESH